MAPKVTHYPLPTDLFSWFQAATKKNIGEFRTFPQGIVVNIGAGYKTIQGTVPLDFPDYDATQDNLPYLDESIAGFIAFGFFEHLTGAVALHTLQEMQRTLVPGGSVLIMVPYYNSQLYAQDLDHKSMWNEETWRCLFNNDCYDKLAHDPHCPMPWAFEVGINLIIGKEERNIFLLTQLIKKSVPKESDEIPF